MYGHASKVSWGVRRLMRRGRKAKSEKAHLDPHRPRCVRSGPPMLHRFSTVRLHILARVRTTRAARAHRPDIRGMRDLQAAGGFDASRLDPEGPDGLLRDRSADRAGVRGVRGVRGACRVRTEAHEDRARAACRHSGACRRRPSRRQHHSVVRGRSSRRRERRVITLPLHDM